MIGVDDRFVFKSGRCSFNTACGALVILNRGVSLHRPEARISPLLADLIAGRLVRTLNCAIELRRDAQGFEIIFKQAPDPVQLNRPPPAFNVNLMEIRDWMERARHPGPFPADMSELLNREGLEVLTWMLTALFRTDFVADMTSLFAVWTPPNANRRNSRPPGSVA